MNVPRDLLREICEITRSARRSHPINFLVDMDTSHHDDEIARIFGASPRTTTDDLALALAKLALKEQVAADATRTDTAARRPRPAGRLQPRALDFEHLTDRTRLFANAADGSYGCNLGRGLP